MNRIQKTFLRVLIKDKLGDLDMAEEQNICSNCGSTMSPGKVATGASDRPPYEEGSVRRYKCDNEECGHVFVDVGLGG